MLILAGIIFLSTACGTAQDKIVSVNLDLPVDWESVIDMDALGAPSSTPYIGTIRFLYGGAQAQVISNLMAAQNDKFVYNIAQFAIGLNPLCTELTGVMLNDEGVLGTIHIGIGTSSNLGGSTKASTHYDVIIPNPFVFLDGEILIKDGKLVG